MPADPLRSSQSAIQPSSIPGALPGQLKVQGQRRGKRRASPLRVRKAVYSTTCRGTRRVQASCAAGAEPAGHCGPALLPQRAPSVLGLSRAVIPATGPLLPSREGPNSYCRHEASGSKRCLSAGVSKEETKAEEKAWQDTGTQPGHPFHSSTPSAAFSSPSRLAGTM